MARTWLPQLSDEEQEEVAKSAEFWVYVKPVALYQTLAERSSKRPNVLRRNLTYTRAFARWKQAKVQTQEGPEPGTFQLNFLGYEYEMASGGWRSQQISVFVSLCEEITTTGDCLYRPLLNWLVHMSPSNKPSLPIPQLPHSGCARGASTTNLVALLIVWDAHPDLGGLKKPGMSRVCTDVWSGSNWLCFGYLPCSSRVWGATVPVFNQQGTMQVQMAPFTLEMYSSELGTHVGFVKCWEARAKSCVCTVNVVAPGSQAFPPDKATRNKEHILAGLQRDVGMASEPVHFLYLYSNNLRYQHEVVERYRCPMCRIECSTFRSMRAHLETSHDLFKYTFSSTDSANLVCVECPANIHTAGGKLISPEAEKLRARQNKTFAYYMPVSTRSFEGRVQYHNALYQTIVGRQECAKFVTRWEQAPQALPCGAESDKEEKSSERLNAHPWHMNEQPESFRTSGELQQDPPENRQHREKACHSEQQTKDTETCSVGAMEAPTALARQQTSPTPQNTNFNPKERWSEGHPFYHCRSAMPMTLTQVLEGPETDDDDCMEEQRMQTYRDIHRLQDINEDERDFFKLWNVFVLGHPIQSDAYTPYACIEFAKQHSSRLAGNTELQRCFALFLLNLYKYGLLSAGALDQCTAIACACEEAQGTTTGQKGRWAERHAAEQSQQTEQLSLDGFDMDIDVDAGVVSILS